MIYRLPDFLRAGFDQDRIFANFGDDAIFETHLSEFVAHRGFAR
jgi:hypothetical protein